MVAMVVILIIVSIDDNLGMIDGLKLKSHNNFSLDITVQDFDVGILFSGGYMGKLLVNTFIIQELPKTIPAMNCEPLSFPSVIPSILYYIRKETKKNHILFFDIEANKVCQHFTTECIYHYQKQRVPLESLDMDVLDVHALGIQRVFYLDLSDAEKLPQNACRSNFR
jgi:hypothetical protein